MPIQGGRSARQKVNYRQFFADSDENLSSEEDPAQADELGITGRDRRAAKREQQRWEKIKASQSESEEHEADESDESGEEESDQGQPQPVVQQKKRRGRPPKNAKPENRAFEAQDDDSGLMSKYGYAGGLSRD